MKTSEIKIITIRIPKNLHHDAKMKLVDQETSFQTFVVEKLKELVN